MKLKLYLLTRTDDLGYDEFDEQLIRAEDQAQARSLVHYADEGKDAWETAEITEITDDGPVGVIIASFRAG